MLSNWFMGAGMVNNAIGSYYSARTTKANLRHQANIADINARIAELGAQSELARGEREQQSSRLKTAHLKSSQRAAMAANGVDLGSDTALNILTSTDVMGEIDANTIEANAIRSAWGYRTNAMNYQLDAMQQRGTADSINEGMAVASSLLGDAGTVASRWRY